jgi:glycerophosphoryl diester phosphodiesterase
MRKRLEVFFLLIGFAVVCGAESARPLVIAHRGGMVHRPQNTLPAFRHAAQIGVEVFEFDMNVTADDRVVLHHDSAINPKVCAPESGVSPAPIRTLTLAQVLRFDCGGGVRIPTLEELFDAFRNSHIRFLGETKMVADGSPGFVPPARFIELVDGLIRKYGVAGRFILQSGDYRTLDEMRKRNPEVGICLLGARRFKPKYLEMAQRHRATHLMLNNKDVDKEGVRKLQAAGYRIFSGTANQTAQWQDYVDMGMDGILTDNPEGLLRFLKTATAQ